APGVTSSFTLSVNVTAAAVPSVTNSASVVTVGDSRSSNDSTSDPTTVKTVADSTKPSCTLTRTATDAQGRKYIEVTVQDTGSGLNQIQVVEQTNLTPAIPAYAVGTTAKQVVRATKIDQALSSQLALHVTDVAGNATDCDPIDQVLTRTPGKPS